MQILVWRRSIEMETWPRLRLDRAKEQPVCERAECTEEGYFLFSVHGGTGHVYIVEVREDVDNWPPMFTCEDCY